MANRLANETSPYLLQHAGNPVDWYPWGGEAFALARSEDRPVLLSVGYSACHWCHVMEHESFEDPETAQAMNDGFVNVKVDREERPDVDSIYMAAVQRMTGHGGWPMTVFLTPDGEPFYGGTYFPPEPRHGMPSFRQVLAGVRQAWEERRDEVAGSAAELRSVLQESTALRAPASGLDPGILEEAYRAIARGYDARNGGFGRAPKFPQPLLLEYLLAYARRTGDSAARAMVEHTLERMWRGGMYDHVGGGFHRYSVDARWLVPHFEKMLYDNALLARLYVHAWQSTGRRRDREIAEEVLDYVMREMRAPEGGFYSAQDADSEGEEGRFYVWTPDEIDAILGDVDGAVVRACFGVTDAGNFEGRSILYRERPDEAIAREMGISRAALRATVDRARSALYAARARRPAPSRDDKVLTAWNALMLRSFAEAGAAFDEPRYTEVAVANAEFLLREMRRDGRLRRSYRAGTAKIDAFLDDHALLADALVSLYQTTFDPRWIAEARALADTFLERFWSEPEGIFYDAAVDGEALVVRPRDVHDSATPSGNSAAVCALLRLHALTGEARYERVAARALESFAALLPQVPQAFGALLTALDFHLAPPTEVALVGAPDDDDTRGFLRVLRSDFRPDTVVALLDPHRPGDAADIVPLLREKTLVAGRPAAYVCRRFACGLPATDPAALDAQLAATPDDGVD